LRPSIKDVQAMEGEEGQTHLDIQAGVVDSNLDRERGPKTCLLPGRPLWMAPLRYNKVNLHSQDFISIRRKHPIMNHPLINHQMMFDNDIIFIRIFRHTWSSSIYVTHDILFLITRCFGNNVFITNNNKYA
jgi:hypothetical protein